MKSLERVRQFFGDVWQGPPTEYWSGKVPSDGLTDKPFNVGDSYFTLRLNEMRLRRERILLEKYVPVCLVIADYFYDGEYRTLPFVVSQDKMRAEVAKLAEGTTVNIEMLDTLIVGPVPVRATEFGLFVGLLGVQRTETVDTLLDIASSLGTSAGLTALTAGLPLAKTVYEGVRKVFSIGKALALVGTRFGFTFQGNKEGQGANGDTGVTSGSFAFTSLPLKVDEAPFVSQAGRLKPAPGRVVVPCDYALVALEHVPERDVFEDLAFHKQFVAIQKRLIETPERDWRPDWHSLMAAIRTSPDLTRRDTSKALVMYYHQLQEEVALSKGETSGAGEPVQSYRAGSSANVVGLLRRAEVARLCCQEPQSVSTTDGKILQQRIQSAKTSLADTAAAIRKAFDKQPLPDPDVIVTEISRETPEHTAGF